MTIEKARFNMIEQQIRPWNVLNLGVLELLTVVHREDFVPSALRPQAFVDTELPLGNGRRMLAPRVEARLLQELKLDRQDRVLEIGAATGHLSALMAHQAELIFAVEPDAALAEAARANLRKAGVQNVRVLQQGGGGGLASEAPFDAILLSGSVAEVPAGLLAQLRVGTGRLIAIVGDDPVMQARLITRVGPDDYRSLTLFETSAARLPGFAELPSFAF
jgi:protein-L-isoaspartate(D-aspartate) O-methyltransferase